jgi:cytochrome c oxidase cbb3-type subunit IV
MSDAMSSMWANSVGVMILVLMLVFIGIWLWAWLPYHKNSFDTLARIPMDNDAPDAASDEGRAR